MKTTMSTGLPASPWRRLNLFNGLILHHAKFADSCRILFLHTIQAEMSIHHGIWILAPFLPLLTGCRYDFPDIDVWYGDEQVFGIPGNPQRAINILGNIQGEQGIEELAYSLNGSEYKQLSLGSDGRRLAREGDFNVEINRQRLQTGVNELLIRASDVAGNKTKQTVRIRYIDNRTWPLPYHVDWQTMTSSDNSYGLDQEKVYLMDGKWRLENGRIRTVEPYYDRVLAFGDSTWENCEVRTDVIFYGHSRPEPGPPTFGVAHVAIAFRWPGHDVDENQPHVKWYPLGVTCEFQISAGRDSCRWRMLYGGRNRTEDRDQNRQIHLGKRYKMAARAETLDNTTSRYSAKLWDPDRPEPDQWDLVGIKENETRFKGSSLLLSHNTDVSFGNVTITPLEVE